jgi:hypothetical protein
MQSLPSIVRPSVRKVAPVLMALGLLTSTASSSFAADQSAVSFDLGAFKTVRKTLICPAGTTLGQDKWWANIVDITSHPAVTLSLGGGARGRKSVTVIITNWDPWDSHHVYVYAHCR